jgi:hypothetical protein
MPDDPASLLCSTFSWDGLASWFSLPCLAVFSELRLPWLCSGESNHSLLSGKGTRQFVGWDFEDLPKPYIVCIWGQYVPGVPVLQVKDCRYFEKISKSDITYPKVEESQK